jgi:hypothetical protein
MTAMVDDFAAIGKTLAPERPDLPADGDAEILALFDAWLRERRAADDADNDPDLYESCLERADAFQALALLTPASGAAGLAIKFYFGLRVEGEGPSGTIDRINTPGELNTLRDAVRFAPVLAPLCRDHLAKETKPLGGWRFEPDSLVAAAVACDHASVEIDSVIVAVLRGEGTTSEEAQS